MNMMRMYMIIVLLYSGQNCAYQFQRLSVLGSSSASPVIGSLLRGLATLAIPHDFNNWANLGDIVYVNSDIGMLQKAIELKRHNRIKRLIAGPNLVVRPIDHNGLVGSQEIDMYLVIF